MFMLVLLHIISPIAMFRLIILMEVFLMAYHMQSMGMIFIVI